MPDSQHLCFYSNKCDWSKAFLTELANTPWKTSFRFVCVDPGPQRPQLPAWLKKVPTLVIAGEKEPRTDGEVMNWLSEMKMKHGGNNSRGGGGGGQSLEGAGGGEPEAFNWAEQTSFTKGFGYSFNDADTSTQGNGGVTIPGAFSFLNGGAAPGDRMGQQIPSMSGGGDRRTKKEQLMDKQMEDYMKERDRGIPQMRPAAM